MKGYKNNTRRGRAMKNAHRRARGTKYVPIGYARKRPRILM